MAKRKMPGNSLKIQGFTRLELVDVAGPEKGRVRRTGWIKNAVTADGFQNYIVNNIGSGLAGGKKIWGFQLATQTDTPTSAQTSASGEFTGTDGARKSASCSYVANGTLRSTASWATNEATQSAIGAVAQYNTSSGGTAASVAIFATSQKTTAQELRVTYDWRFS
jgi:hypothetical protein